MDEGERFIRDEAAPRGIDGDTAVTVARMEGGTAPPGLVGEFDTGCSWWQFQLHYGGPEYPQYGVPGTSVAGMGNDFSAFTGWAPGDPAAWRDACRYALNRAKEGGWGPWYGAAAAGITGFDGIDQSVAWDPNSQTWDYETMATAPPSEPVPVYDATYPAIAQNDSWSCSCTSTRWALWAYGREPSESWLESSMLSAGIVTQAYGLMDASGAGLAGWISAEYGPAQYGGYRGENDASVTFDDVAHEAEQGKHPLCIGGRAWGHWTGVRGFDGLRLQLANPAPGYMGISQTLSREQFSYLGPFSLVRLVNPRAEEGGAVPPVPSGDPYAPWAGLVGTGLLQMMAEDAVLPAQSKSTWLPLGQSPADIEEAVGENGVTYRWLLRTSAGYRMRPS